MVEKESSESERLLGRDAQRNNILAARIIAETIKTTLGPKGMDKMLVDRAGGIIVTNDGVTILREMEIEHPAAKMIVEISKTQEKEVGDGTTTAVMLAGKLLENAEKLLDKKIHPTTITSGYRVAEKEALKILDEISFEIDSKEELLKIAQTAMTGKGAEYLKEKFSKIIVDAVEIVAEDKIFEVGDIKIEKQKGKSIEDTELVHGVILDSGKVNIDMPKKIFGSRILLLEEGLEVKELEIDSRISVSRPDQIQSFLDEEELILKSKVEKIKKLGANVLFVKGGIDELVSFHLAKERIYAVSRVSKEELQNISKATGGKIISKLSEASAEYLGHSKEVYEGKYGDEFMTYVMGCKNPKSLTILIKGGTDHIVDEIERAFNDALGDVCVALRDSKIVAGGGAVEVELARRLRKFAMSVRGREKLAVEEFASAMEFVPSTLAENAGMDPIDVMGELNLSHESGGKNFGINLFNGKVEDMINVGIIEPLRVKTQAISSASEVAIMILRIDDVIAAKKISGGKGGRLRKFEDYE